jgi:hypothetical protein
MGGFTGGTGRSRSWQSRARDVRSPGMRRSPGMSQEADEASLGRDQHIRRGSVDTIDTSRCRIWCQDEVFSELVQRVIRSAALELN